MHATGLRSACALAQAHPKMSCIHLIIKPVTGIERICSASLKTTRTLIVLGFHKEKEVCQHSHSSDLVPAHTIHAICCNILLYAIYWYVKLSVLNCTALCRIATH